jgi:hypothetical protein
MISLLSAHSLLKVYEFLVDARHLTGEISAIDDQLGERYLQFREYFRFTQYSYHEGNS